MIGFAITVIGLYISFVIMCFLLTILHSIITFFVSQPNKNEEEV